MRLLIALSLILLATIPAASQQPQKPDPNQTQLTPTYRGTEQAPFIVKTIPEDKTPDQTIAEIKKAELDRKTVKLTEQLVTYTWLLFLATGVLAVGTIGIIVVAYCQMREARKAITAAEKSAITAERALVELERPLVYAEVTKPGIEVRSLPDYREVLRRTEFELSFFNYGRTPAILTRVFYKMSAAPTGGIASPIDPKAEGGRELPIGIISAADRPYLEGGNLPFSFIGMEADILEKRQSIWLIGFVRYRDIFGTNHITGFAKVLDVFAPRFVVRGDERYNYAHQEKTDDIPAPSSQG